jgi:hypothetical protein
VIPTLEAGGCRDGGCIRGFSLEKTRESSGPEAVAVTLPSPP